MACTPTPAPDPATTKNSDHGRKQNYAPHLTVGGVISFLPKSTSEKWCFCTFPRDLELCKWPFCACHTVKHIPDCSTPHRPKPNPHATNATLSPKWPGSVGRRLGQKILSNWAPLWRYTLIRDHDPTADPTQACDPNHTFSA